MIYADCSWTLDHDSAGQRLTKVEGGTTTKFVYDGAKVVLERDGDDETEVRYTHEGGSLYDDLLSQRRDGASYDYLLDGLASVKQVVDSSQAIENSYSYEAFGQASIGQSDVANPYLYLGGQGARWEGTPGLYFAADRYYDPSFSIDLGRYRRAWLHFCDPVPWRPLQYLICMQEALSARDRANKAHGSKEHRACWALKPIRQERAAYENAYRHCLWMCELSRAQGESCALMAEMLHEGSNYVEALLLCGLNISCWKNYAYDTLHDLHNNLVGVDCRNQGGTCWDCCNTAYYEQRLLPDKPFWS